MKYRTKANGSVSSLALLLALGVLLILYVIQFCSGYDTAVVSVRAASWLGIVMLAVIVGDWKSRYYRLLSPSFIVVLSLYLVLCGQSLMWAFGLEAGYRDLIQSPNWGFNEFQIVRGLIFSELCILVLYITVAISIDCNTSQTKHKKDMAFVGGIDERSSYTAIAAVAVVVVLVSIGPYLLDFYQTYSYVKLYGYDDAYNQITYGFDSLTAKVGAFFPVGVVMLMLCWGKKDKLNQDYYVWKAIACYGLIAVIIGTSLVLGRRTNLILFALGLLVVWFKDKKMNRSAIVLIVVICVAGMAGMRLIDMLRSESITGIDAFFSYFLSSDENPVVDFLGDIGWNLLSTIEVQTLIPSQKEFACGVTYIASLTSVIPNLGFWAIHPASEYGMASTWLQNAMGLSYGVGFSPVAESFYNFGAFGPLMFILWGRFLVFLNRLYESPDNPFAFLLPVIFTGVIAKSFVRSCFAAVFRPAFLYMLVIPLVVYFVAKQIESKRGLGK